MPDDCKMADRRRKKRIGVSKKFCTSVHLYEHTSKAGHIPVCRGGHWPSAVKTKKIQHTDANSQPNRVRICIGAFHIWGIVPRTSDARPYTRIRTPRGRCSYGCTYVRNFLETPIRFFLRLSTISWSSSIPCKTPNKTRKPKHSEPRVIQKGQDPFGRFK